MDDELRAYKLLASAIVLRAVKDYREAILRGDRKTEKECERFFRSGYCSFLSGIKEEYTAEKIRRTTLEFRDRAYEIFVRKYANGDKKKVSRAFICPSCGGWALVRYGNIIRGFHDAKGYIATCHECGLEVKKSETYYTEVIGNG